jgi:hypothetical protein
VVPAGPAAAAEAGFSAIDFEVYGLSESDAYDAGFDYYEIMWAYHSQSG